MHRPHPGLLATLLALNACAYASQSASPEAASPTTSSDMVLAAPHGDDDGDAEVVLFGDSLSQLAETETRDLFVADPDLRISAQFYGGTEFDTETWIEGYRQIEEGSIVLLFLGSNDVFTDAVSTATGDATRAIDALTDAGASKVVVPTVNGSSTAAELGEDWATKVAAYNEWLREAAANDTRFPTLEVAEWELMSRDNMDWLKPDGVHTTAAGQAAFAQMTLDAARAAVEDQPR